MDQQDKHSQSSSASAKSKEESRERTIAPTEIKEEANVYFSPNQLDLENSGAQNFQVLKEIIENSNISLTDTSISLPFNDEEINHMFLVNEDLNEQEASKVAIDFGNLINFHISGMKDEAGGSTSHHVKYKPAGNGKNVKIWECGLCHKEFGHQYILMRHLPTHTDERKFECRQCGKAFRQMSTLSQHRAIHSKLRPYVCEVCQKTFNRVSTLISHRKTHTGMKPHRCHLCDKAFHQKGNLRNHIFTHTNERPYKCDICQKGFNQMSNLMCHKFKAHQRADKPKYNCPTCAKEFEKRISLRNHEQYEHGEVSSNANIDQIFKPIPQRPMVIPSVKYTNGVLVSKINTAAMQSVLGANQMPFAILKPVEGISVLVRVLLAGDNHMLVPATADDLSKYGRVDLDGKESSKKESDENAVPANGGNEAPATNGNVMMFRVPIVACVVQRRRNGVVCMDIEDPVAQCKVEEIEETETIEEIIEVHQNEVVQRNVQVNDENTVKEDEKLKKIQIIEEGEQFLNTEVDIKTEEFEENDILNDSPHETFPDQMQTNFIEIDGDSVEFFNDDMDLEETLLNMPEDSNLKEEIGSNAGSECDLLTNDTDMEDEERRLFKL